LPTSYLSNLTYDIFGRPRVITHGNGTADTRSYGDKTTNFRLNSITTKKGSTTLLSYSYSSYTATGLLRQLNDLGPQGTGNVMNNTATFTYDGLGRLTQVSGNTYLNTSYGYGDHLGNLTAKDGTTFSYSASKPHQLTSAIGGAVTYDANGNRWTKQTGTQTYSYTPDDRLSTVAVSGQPSVSMYYDYTGQKVAQRKAGSSPIRYYSTLAEVDTDGKLVKHYFAGGMRIATQRVTAPAGMASVDRPAIMFAQVPAGTAAMVVLVREDWQRGALLAIGVVGTGLLMAPWRKKRVVGVRVRYGHVIGVIIAFEVATLPLPLFVKPASAQVIPGQGLYHYHADHLGSTQVITDSTGTVVEYIRYKAYGEVRGRYNASGGTITTFYRYEFTGYESEWTSGLEYAGARHYDPALGMFLTHDPAREFASPYSYIDGDPVNGTDPNGECELLCVVIIALVATFAASAIDAGVKSGDVGTAFKAGGTSLAMTVVGPLSPGLQLVAPKEFGAFNARDWAISQIPVAGSAYGTAQNFENGNYASGVVGVAATVYQAFGVYQNASGAYQSGGWSAAATSVANDVTAPFIGENFGAAWRSGIADTLSGNWVKAETSAMYVPESWAGDIKTVEDNLLPDSASHGHHDWHAGTNALLARKLGILGVPFLLAGGVIHETPIDWRSFWGENERQGTYRHLYDSAGDIAANIVGAAMGRAKLNAPTNVLVGRAMEWGNHIPGPYDIEQLN
jgi:RHS repeat-associated protein